MLRGGKAEQCVGCLSKHDVGKRRGQEPVMEKARDSFYPREELLPKDYISHRNQVFCSWPRDIKRQLPGESCKSTCDHRPDSTCHMPGRLFAFLWRKEGNGRVRIFMGMGIDK